VGALAEELLAAGLIDRGVDVLHHVELVEDDRGLGQVLAETLEEGLPHVDAHRLDRATAARRQILGEEAVQRRFLALRPAPDRLARGQVGDHRQALALAPEDLVDPHPPQRAAPATLGPRPKRSLVDPPHRLRREAPLRGHSPHRRIFAVPRHRGRKARRVGMLSFQELDPLPADSASAAVDTMRFESQRDLPAPPRQIADPSFPNAVDPLRTGRTAAACVERARRRLPHPDRQSRPLLLEFPSVGLVADKAQNPPYNLLGHPLTDLLSRLASENEILRRRVPTPPQFTRASPDVLRFLAQTAKSKELWGKTGVSSLRRQGSSFEEADRSPWMAAKPTLTSAIARRRTRIVRDESRVCPPHMRRSRGGLGRRRVVLKGSNYPRAVLGRSGAP
jgi:hypothetical protein